MLGSEINAGVKMGEEDKESKDAEEEEDEEVLAEVPEDVEKGGTRSSELDSLSTQATTKFVFPTAIGPLMSRFLRKFRSTKEESLLLSSLHSGFLLMSLCSLLWLESMGSTLVSNGIPFLSLMSRLKFSSGSEIRVSCRKSDDNRLRGRAVDSRGRDDGADTTDRQSPPPAGGLQKRKVVIADNRASLNKLTWD